jgi:hypothetical protein
VACCFDRGGLGDDGRLVHIDHTSPVKSHPDVDDHAVAENGQHLGLSNDGLSDS